jgi:hypothetical protein
MKRNKIVDADASKLSDEHRTLFRTKIQRVLRQEIAAIRRTHVKSPA